MAAFPVPGTGHVRVENLPEGSRSLPPTKNVR